MSELGTSEWWTYSLSDLLLFSPRTYYRLFELYNEAVWPMHVAAALGVPVVAVFGPTDERETGPVGHGHRIVREPVHCSPCGLRECPIDHRCMTRIGVDRVAAEAREALARG